MSSYFRCAEQVLMATGFVFIGTAGGALLLDETGMQRLAPADVNGVLKWLLVAIATGGGGLIAKVLYDVLHGHVHLV